MSKYINFLDLSDQTLANNYLRKNQLIKKEKKFISNGGKVIIHTPVPKII